MQRRTIDKNKNITIHQKVTKITTNQYKNLQNDAWKNIWRSIDLKLNTYLLPFISSRAEAMCFFNWNFSCYLFFSIKNSWEILMKSSQETNLKRNSFSKTKWTLDSCGIQSFRSGSIKTKILLHSSES